MYDIKTIDTDHKDVVHDIAFDFYGRRMATCSSDRSIKIWQLNEGGSWELQHTIESKCGAVWKVTWAHPEFGQIIATCCFDRSCTIYEEIVNLSGQGMETTWQDRYSLNDARGSVTDIKFAPKEMGLVLATCTSDGMVRIYEAPDIMDLKQWTPNFDLNTRLPSCSCITWNPSVSRITPPLIVVGSDDCCIGMGTGPGLLAPLASTYAGSRVSLFAYNDRGMRWEQVEMLSTVTDPVHDVAFAPNSGRSYHTLAIASKELRIIILKPKSANSDGSCGGFEMQQAAQFSDLGSEVWRVSWNNTGTVLTASGDNGLVKIYKGNYLDVWQCVGTLSASSAVSGDSSTTLAVAQTSSASFASVAASHGSSSSLTGGATIGSKGSTPGAAVNNAGRVPNYKRREQ